MTFWLQTVTYDPDRIEGVLQAMSKALALKQFALVHALYKTYYRQHAPKEDKLFIDRTKYMGIMDTLNAIAAFYVHAHESGIESTIKVLEHPDVQPNFAMSAISNFTFYTKFVKDMSNDTKRRLVFAATDKLNTLPSIDQQVYAGWLALLDSCKSILVTPDPLVIQSLSKHGKKKKGKDRAHQYGQPVIVLTMTTCKRYDLFEQTLSSILNTWTDLSRITHWIVIDDNSSESDRLQMRTKFPWIQYIWKDESQKGHRTSMNMILDKLKSLSADYWIQMEDDFMFHARRDYVGQALQGLSTLPSVKQVLFNRIYAETMMDRRIQGGIKAGPFLIHEHKQGTFPYVNQHYWPHFSFRPSIIDVRALDTLGNFDSERIFFERAFADKYAAAGFKSAFFDEIVCMHIGCPTGKNDKPNAYKLNNVEQFDPRPSVAPSSPVPIPKFVDMDTDYSVSLAQNQAKHVELTSIQQVYSFCLDWSRMPKTPSVTIYTNNVSFAESLPASFAPLAISIHPNVAMEPSGNLIIVDLTTIHPRLIAESKCIGRFLHQLSSPGILMFLAKAPVRLNSPFYTMQYAFDNHHVTLVFKQ